jgi:hypothetical protein
MILVAITFPSLCMQSEKSEQVMAITLLSFCLQNEESEKV